MYNEFFFQKGNTTDPVSPSLWPFVRKGESLWADYGEQKEIFLIGNYFTWNLCIFGIVLYIATVSILQALLQRNIDPFGKDIRSN